MGYLVNVFKAAEAGGNPAPIVLDAIGMTGSEKQGVARDYGRESAFILPAPKDSRHNFSL